MAINPTEVMPRRVMSLQAEAQSATLTSVGSSEKSWAEAPLPPPLRILKIATFFGHAADRRSGHTDSNNGLYCKPIFGKYSLMSFSDWPLTSQASGHAEPDELSQGKWRLALDWPR